MFHSYKRRWHRFRSHRRRPHGAARARWRDAKLDQQYVTEPIAITYVCQSTDFFDCAEEEVVSLLQRRPEVHALDRYIDRLRARHETSGQPHDGLVALLAQAPRAVLAQKQMDTFEHGYRNKRERLYELIDFNDTLVATILAMTPELRDQFAVRTKQAADRMCQRVGAPCFSDEQWTAIIRGLTREVAVYMAAKESGFAVVMTDRAHDALGIDMQVQDAETGRYINIDVKTPSSFRHRMEQLVREGRLTERELLRGDHDSYVVETNGHGAERTQIIVLCILPDLFGELTDWRFINTEPMRNKLNQLIRDHGLTDRRFGVV